MQYSLFFTFSISDLGFILKLSSEMLFNWLFKYSVILLLLGTGAGGAAEALKDNPCVQGLDRTL